MFRLSSGGSTISVCDTVVQNKGPRREVRQPAGSYGDPAGNYGGPAGNCGDPVGNYGDPAGNYGDPARNPRDPVFRSSFGGPTLTFCDTVERAQMQLGVSLEFWGVDRQHLRYC